MHQKSPTIVGLFLISNDKLNRFINYQAYYRADHKHAADNRRYRYVFLFLLVGMYPFFVLLKTFLFFPVIAVRRKVQPEKRRERVFQAVERAFIGRPVKRGETKQYYAGNEKPVAQKPCDFDARKFSAINSVHSRYDKKQRQPYYQGYNRFCYVPFSQPSFPLARRFLRPDRVVFCIPPLLGRCRTRNALLKLREE